MSEQTDSRSTDLVMGGAVPPPINAVVLGGIEGLKARFEQADIEQKRSILSEAIQHGNEGIALVWHGLEDDELKVRSHSYFLLKSVGINAPELEMGIPLRIGDRIYGVYQAEVTYGDDWYYIYDSVEIEEEDWDEDDEWDEEWEREEYPFYQPSATTDDRAFEYISDAPEDNQVDSEFALYHPSLVCYCIEQNGAERAAEVANLEKFEHLGCEIYEVSGIAGVGSIDLDIDLQAWIETQGIIVDAKIPDYWSNYCEPSWIYTCCVLASLQKQKRFDLLYELWKQMGRRPLGFVHEHIIDRNCYLRLSNHHAGT